MLDDLFSSSKGPGLIGLLLGLFVLAGFCGLGFAVFDGRLNGDFANRRQKELSRNEQKITNLENRLKEDEAKGKKWKDLKVAASKLEGISTQLKICLGKESELAEEVSRARTEVADLQEEWKDYTRQYQEGARVRIKGRKLDELTTADGLVYKNVEIREATALEVRIMTAEGPKRVGLELLPKDIQDELQFDPEEAKILALKVEDAGQDLAELHRIGSRISFLNGQIRAMQGAIAKHDEMIATAPARKRANEDAARAAEEKSREFMEAYREDKAAGRPSRNDDRAAVADREAVSHRARNLQIDREVAKAGEEKQSFKNTISDHEREIKALQERREAILEERKNAADTANPQPE